MENAGSRYNITMLSLSSVTHITILHEKNAEWISELQCKKKETLRIFSRTVTGCNAFWLSQDSYRKMSAETWCYKKRIPQISKIW